MGDSEVSSQYTLQTLKTLDAQIYKMSLATLFKWLNWIGATAIIVFSCFTGINRIDVDMYDMRRHCDDEAFLQIPIPVSKILLVGTMSGLITFLMCMLNSRIVYSGKFLVRDFVNFVNFVMGLLMCLIMCSFLQNLVGYPYPEFFVNQKLKWFYCCQNCPNLEFTEELRNINLLLRGSFPSTYICVAAYLTAYLVLFAYYLDVAKSFPAKVFLLLVPGFVVAYYGVLLWKNNHHHLQDIIGGGIIGIAIAVFTTVDLFTNNKSKEECQENYSDVIMTRQSNNIQNYPIATPPGDEEYTVSSLPSQMEMVELRGNNDLPPNYSTLTTTSL